MKPVKGQSNCVPGDGFRSAAKTMMEAVRLPPRGNPADGVSTTAEDRNTPSRARSRQDYLRISRGEERRLIVVEAGIRPSELGLVLAAKRVRVPAELFGLLQVKPKE